MLPQHLWKQLAFLTVVSVVGILYTCTHRQFIPILMRNKFVYCNRTDMHGRLSGEKWMVIGTASLSDDVTLIPEVTEWNVVVVHNSDRFVKIQIKVIVRRSIGNGSHKDPFPMRSSPYDRRKPIVFIAMPCPIFDHGCTSCYCLDADALKNLQLKTFEKLPTGHSNQILLGYLFAVIHGAKYINTIDDFTHVGGSYILEESTTGLRYNSSVVFNQYSHFGQPTIWPNGFPSDLKKGNISLKYYQSNWRTPLIQQQVDSVTMFDPVAPPVFLGAGTLAVINPQTNSLYVKEAFWALFRSLSVNPVSQILRSFWRQRLLWEIGGTFGFLHSNSKHISSRNKNVLDIPSNNTDVLKAVDFIQNWKCPRSKPFDDCIVQLAVNLIQFGAFSTEDIDILKAWLHDLSNLLIWQPNRCEDYHSCELNNHGLVTPVHFWPNVRQQPQNIQVTARKHQEGIKTICPNISDVARSSKPFLTFPNILLIVVFNFPHHYKNIQYIEKMYRAHFPNILYCGEKFENFQKFQKGFNKNVSFVEADVILGMYAFRCLMRAIEMKYNVDGYLYMGDDVLLNTWTLKTFDQQKFWLKFPVFWLFQQKTLWTTENKTYFAWLKILDEMKARNLTEYINFVNQWKENTKRNDGVYQQFLDIMYVPQGSANRFLHFIDYFSRYPTHVEFAVPNMLAGMGSYNNYVSLMGNYVQAPYRPFFEKFFNENYTFLHPAKTGPLLKSTNGTKFYCETYFPFEFTV